LQHPDQLTAAGGQCAQPLIADHTEAPTAPAQFLRGEGMDQPGIDRIGLGPDAAALAKGDDVVGVNPDNGMPRSCNTAIRIRSWPPVSSNATRSGATRSSQPATAAALLARAIDPDVEPILGNIDPGNRLVSHSLSPQNAGGSEMATVVKTHPRPEYPPASPSHRWGADNAIHVDHRGKPGDDGMGGCASGEMVEGVKQPAISRRGIAKRLYGFLLRPEASVIVVTAALVLYFEIANQNFLTNANVQTLSQFVAAPVIIACGEIMLLICREIDLSVGQVFALAPFLMQNGHDFGLPVPLAILAALATCALIGLIIGLITIGLRVPSFITTLGMLFLITGLTLTISRGYPANTAGGPLLSGIMGVWAYSEIIWALVIVAIMHVVLRHTRWGLHTTAIGGNIIAAAEAGIAINRIKIGNFVLTSTLGGLTGLLEAFRVGSIDPLAGGSNIPRRRLGRHRRHRDRWRRWHDHRRARRRHHARCVAGRLHLAGH